MENIEENRGILKFEGGGKKKKIEISPSVLYRYIDITANEGVNRETLLLIRRSFILSPPVEDDDRDGRYLLRRTDQDSIHVPVHLETVCQSRDSNATL